MHYFWNFNKKRAKHKSNNSTHKYTQIQYNGTRGKFDDQLSLPLVWD